LLPSLLKIVFFGAFVVAKIHALKCIKILALKNRSKNPNF